MKTKQQSFEEKFAESANGYGFTEIEQSIDGVYCTGCGQTHKRPTKMYANLPAGRTGRDVMCKAAIVRFYPIEE